MTALIFLFEFFSNMSWSSVKSATCDCFWISIIYVLKRKLSSFKSHHITCEHITYQTSHNMLYFKPADEHCQSPAQPCWSGHYCAPSRVLGWYICVGIYIALGWYIWANIFKTSFAIVSSDRNWEWHFQSIERTRTTSCSDCTALTLSSATDFSSASAFHMIIVMMMMIMSFY